ncbi:MAG: sugar phosphate isomerase/epimerase family protein [Solirubrobacterales bacterium]
MKIGLSSACFYPELLTENSIEFINMIGFNSGEIFLNTISEYEEDYIKKLNEEKEKYEFNVESVHCFSSALEPYLFEGYKRRRQDMFKYFKQVCRAAKILGAKYYTFHGMRKLDNYSIDKKFTAEIYDKLNYTALEEGVILAQENVCWCMSSDIDYLNMLKEECRYPVKFTLDIKQAYRAGVNLEKYVETMGNDIVNVHINDRDEHNTCLLPGKGSVDYDSLIKQLKGFGYKGNMIIEVYKDNFKENWELIDARDFLNKKLVKYI